MAPTRGPVIGSSTGVLLLSTLPALAMASSSEGHVENGTSGRFEIIDFRPEHVKTPVVIALYLIAAGLAKVAFHKMRFLTKVFPESCLLILLGLLVGAILRVGNVDVGIYQMQNDVFFLYLLPPIIFDAGYFMPNRALFENFVPVMFFAFVGTIWNTMAIGGALYAVHQFFPLLFGATTYNLFEILLFSALVSAVDPVAVIALFEEIHVNEFLFINVFGEALFNDGVTVMLYQLFSSFTSIAADPLNAVQSIDYVSGALALFVNPVLSAAIGITAAFLCALLTKHTDQVRTVNPLFIFCIPYVAYLSAELFALSPIIAVAVCGMTMKQYIKDNITATAANSVKYFVKMAAQAAETIIFMFLGLSTISTELTYDPVFIAITIACCLVFRTIGVVVQCAILNQFRAKKFSFVDQFVLSYGGLRGAIAFGLASAISPSVSARETFITATIALIYFTVFLQGITIRPLVNCLKVERKTMREQNMTESIYGKYFDYMMAGVEEISGLRGNNTMRDYFERLNARILRPVLTRNVQTRTFDASKIVRAYARIMLEEAARATAINDKRRSTAAAKHRRIDELKCEEGVLPASNPVSPRPRSASESTTTSPYATITASGGLPTTETRRGLREYLSSDRNMEELYVLFSSFLDRKLQEEEVHQEGTARCGEAQYSTFM